MSDEWHDELRAPGLGCATGELFAYFQSSLIWKGLLLLFCLFFWGFFCCFFKEEKRKQILLTLKGNSRPAVDMCFPYLAPAAHGAVSSQLQAPCHRAEPPVGPDEPPLDAHLPAVQSHQRETRPGPGQQEGERQRGRRSGARWAESCALKGCTVHEKKQQFRCRIKVKNKTKNTYILNIARLTYIQLPMHFADLRHDTCKCVVK